MVLIYLLSGVCCYGFVCVRFLLVVLNWWLLGGLWVCWCKVVFVDFVFACYLVVLAVGFVWLLVVLCVGFVLRVCGCVVCFSCWFCDFECFVLVLVWLVISICYYVTCCCWFLFWCLFWFVCVLGVIFNVCYTCVLRLLFCTA